MPVTSYRYPNEQWILAGTVVLVVGILVVIASATFCIVIPFFFLFVGLSFWMNRAQHQALLQSGFPVSPQRTPNMSRILQDCQKRLHPGAVEVFIVRSNDLNAYTFGVTSPEVIVVYSSVLEVMDEDELRFILGHEMGHVALGHSTLNTLLGGMAGVPVTFGAAVVLILAFRSWNRACEYSADRAGLLACGKPSKAISALVRLVAGDIRTSAEFQHAMQLIEQEDDSVSNLLAESLSTHPLIIKRIQELRHYAASPEYQRLQAQVNADFIK
jgi:Zn-dependent protease with chaperone function